MRTTVTLDIDDELLAAASAAIGVSERSIVLHEGPKLLIQRDAARWLVLLGGTDPTASIAPWRRYESAVKVQSKRSDPGRILALDECPNQRDPLALRGSGCRLWTEGKCLGRLLITCRRRRK